MIGDCRRLQLFLHWYATMCSLERHGDVYILCLKGDVDEHRLNPALCEEIISNLAIVNESDAKALVTTNEGKFFSNGLDLAWVNQDPATRAPAQTEAFSKLCEAFMQVNVPTIAAICGHAAAGGFILAMAHDHRYMRGDRGLLYMSEIDISIVIPLPIMRLLRCKMEPRAFKEVVLKGLKLTANAARDLGLVDAVHSTATATFDAALAEATLIATKNWQKDVYLGLRQNMYPEFAPKIEAKL